jgi:hypothetical protein
MSAALYAGARSAYACNPGDIVIGETPTEWICRRATNTDLPECSSIPDSLAGLERLRNGLRNQLQSNNREAVHNADALDEWSEFLTEKRDEARKKSIKIAITEVIGSSREKFLDRAADKAAALRDLRVEQAGLMRREWGALVTRLSQMSPSVKSYLLGRISEANTLEKAIDFLKDSWNAIDDAYGLGSDAVEANWQTKKVGAVTLLRITAALVTSNPVIHWLQTDLEAGENALYGWWSVLAARNRLRQFIALEDNLLRQQIADANRYVLVNNAWRGRSQDETYCIP